MSKDFRTIQTEVCMSALSCYQEEEESEEEKMEQITPSSPPYPNIGLFTDLQHRNGRGEMGQT